MHYLRWRKHEDPTGQCRPTWGLTEADRFASYVNKDANALGCWLWTGSRNNNGYGRFRLSRFGKRQRTVLAHRFAYEQVNGPIPDGLVVDHTCHNRHCVNPNHLRLVTNQDNCQNRGGLSPNNTSGFNGVSMHHGRFQAQINLDGHTVHLGYFATAEEAGAVAAEARRRHYNLADIRKDKA